MPANLRVLSAATLLVITSGCGRTPLAEPVYVGHIAPLSGGSKAAGEQARQAIDLALEEVNSPGRQKDKRPLFVLHVDSHGEINNLQPEAVRLISVNHVVALVGGMDLAGAERLGKAAQPYSVPVVSLTELPATPLAENVFSVNADLAAYGWMAAQFVNHELKAKRTTTLVDERSAGASSFGEAMTRALRASGERRTQEWSFKTDQELAGLAERLNKQETEALAFAGSASDLSVLCKKLKSMKAAVPILYVGGGTSLSFLATDLQTLNGVYVLAPFFAAGAEHEAFVNKYTERFHQKPEAYAALAYDAIHIVASALAQSTSAGPEKLLVSLQKPDLEFTGLFGNMQLDRSQSVDRPLFVGQVQSGEIRHIKRYDPKARDEGRGRKDEG